MLWAPGLCLPVSPALPQRTLRGHRVCPLDQATVTTHPWYWTGDVASAQANSARNAPPPPYPVAGQRTPLVKGREIVVIERTGRSKEVTAFRTMDTGLILSEQERSHFF